MNGNEYDGLDFGESCDYDVHERNEQLTAENAKLREQLAEAVGLLKKCTSPYSTTADRLRALDVAEAWLAEQDA